jgi:hypothetical protein
MRLLHVVPAPSKITHASMSAVMVTKSDFQGASSASNTVIAAPRRRSQAIWRIATQNNPIAAAPNAIDTSTWFRATPNTATNGINSTAGAGGSIWQIAMSAPCTHLFCAIYVRARTTASNVVL